MILENFFLNLKESLLDVVAPPSARARRMRAIHAPYLAALAAKMREARYAPEIETLLPYRNADVRALVLQMKYRRDPRALSLAAPLLAEVLIAVCAEMLGAPLLIPVPMHAKRRRERGFNQTELLCEQVIKHESQGQKNQGRTLIDERDFFEYAPRALTRVRAGVPQQKLPRRLRLANMNGAMRADPAIVRGRNCIVVDDVSTTGATLMECKRALKKAGAKSVYLLALAG